MLERALEKSSFAECFKLLVLSSPLSDFCSEAPPPGEVWQSVSSSNSVSNDLMPLSASALLC